MLRWLKAVLFVVVTSSAFTVSSDASAQPHAWNYRGFYRHSYAQPYYGYGGYFARPYEYYHGSYYRPYSYYQPLSYGAPYPFYRPYSYYAPGFGAYYAW